MSGTTKIKISRHGDLAKVLVLIKHDMEDGQRVGTDGHKIPAHYINTIDFTLNGELAAQALLGPGVSRNPLVGIMLSGVRSGDRVAVKWMDNKDQTGNASGSIT